MKTDHQIRLRVKSLYGGANARVTRNGEIHVRGVMPNTNKIGWYFFGFTGHNEIEDKLWWPDNSEKRLC
jgi:hypothetical protein